MTNPLAGVRKDAMNTDVVPEGEAGRREDVWPTCPSCGRNLMCLMSIGEAFARQERGDWPAPDSYYHCPDCDPR